MVSTTIAVEAGPRPLLAYLLLHHRADAATLSATLGRDDAQVNRSLNRLVRRGLVAGQDGQYEDVPARRTAVADYAEGALTLRALAGK